MNRLFPALLALACAITTRAAIHTKAIEYKQGDTTLEGFLAYDDSPHDQSENARQLTTLRLNYAAMSAELEKLKSLDKDKLKNVLPTIAPDPQLNDYRQNWGNPNASHPSRNPVKTTGKSNRQRQL